MTCGNCVGRVLLAALFLLLGVCALYESKPNEVAVLANLNSSCSYVAGLTTAGRVRAVSSVLAGLMVVGAMLQLLNAKGKGCVMGTALLLHSWLVEGLFTAQVMSPMVIVGILKNTSVLGAILVF